MKALPFLLALLLPAAALQAQGTVYDKPFSPSEGLVKSVEQPLRDEICLNGLWSVQCVPIPEGWKGGSGTAPELPPPDPSKWDEVRLKVPSPINVNAWGGGFRTGEGTDKPYAPSSVYFPSYPEKWCHARMAWIKRDFTVPSEWKGRRLILHFEAVAGECAVYVNGVECARHFENHLPFEVDITDCARIGSSNEIMLGLRHPKLFDKKHPDYPYMGATYPTGSNTDDLLGPWQDVFLLALPEVRIEDIFIQPFVDRGELVIKAAIRNDSRKKVRVRLDAVIREWINLARDPAEISWTLGKNVDEINARSLVPVAPGKTVEVTLRRNIPEGLLKYWSPDNPSLYTAVLYLDCGFLDVKSERFGWRQLKISGDGFYLNGSRIQCFGDIQHPFSAYVCSRRFAWAWYRMIKDFGGNAVRPHAQPWPRCYYDLADEMGLMVLDETALFGSSIRMNFEEPSTWVNCREQLDNLIKRDRNHPSVIGWSAGNETFAIALLNKAPASVAAGWNDSLAALALHALEADPTRQFVTLDGDRDMDGRLPVWSKHFGHGLHLEDLPEGLGKPLVVGENGATYYGKPDQLVQFAGMLPYVDYKGRNEALARDLYQNVREMALPCLAYFSPSEVSWFGLEHLNLGYRDFSRLPGLSDGIFPSMEYREGVPGYQYERIPPYVTTFNPGLDPELPCYKPLAMFQAYKAALSGKDFPAPDPTVPEIARPEGEILFDDVFVPGGCSPELASFFGAAGVRIASELGERTLLVLDAAKAEKTDIERVRGVRCLALTRDGALSESFMEWIGSGMKPLAYPCSALESPDGAYRPDELYFGGEGRRSRKIALAAIGGDILEKAEILLVPSRTDWTLFNDVPEQWKCAQVVLYEALEKPEASCLLRLEKDGSMLTVSSLDYSNLTPSALTLWKKIFRSEGLATADRDPRGERSGQRAFNLLMDGPPGAL
jgi:beta-galactosidase